MLDETAGLPFKYEISNKPDFSLVFFKNKLIIFHFFFGHFEKEKKSDTM
jgi:hypothetical protein